MKKYIFDANAISLWIDDSLPEKWIRPWKEILSGNSYLLLFEELISETYYKNIKKHGKRKSKDKIRWLKGQSRTNIYTPDNNDAFNAGDIKIDFQSKRLSLVDCFIISIAKSNSAKIITTDRNLRDVARDMKIQVDYLPY